MEDPDKMTAVLRAAPADLLGAIALGSMTAYAALAAKTAKVAELGDDPVTGCDQLLHFNAPLLGWLLEHTADNLLQALLADDAPMTPFLLARLRELVTACEKVYADTHTTERLLLARVRAALTAAGVVNAEACAVVGLHGEVWVRCAGRAGYLSEAARYARVPADLGWIDEMSTTVAYVPDALWAVACTLPEQTNRARAPQPTRMAGDQVVQILREAFPQQGPA